MIAALIVPRIVPLAIPRIVFLAVPLGLVLIVVVMMFVLFMIVCICGQWKSQQANNGQFCGSGNSCQKWLHGSILAIETRHADRLFNSR